MLFQTVYDINRDIAQEGAKEYMERCDAEYKAQLTKAAEQILANADRCPIVVLAGPSGSGKTTSACIIESILDASGHETHTLSTDNYFFRQVDMDMPVDEEGNIDYESPLLVDSELLQDHLEKLIAGETIGLPEFDFVAQTRKEKTTPLTRKPGELIIIEGIHALNPEVIGPRFAETQRVYVSARTRVIYKHKILHPAMVRLMRRMLRDARGRGRNIEETAEKYNSVQRGEDLYIMPYKHYAEISINTSVPYELALYRTALLPLLETSESDDKKIAVLKEVLGELNGMDLDLPAEDAMVREFIGGSIFE